MTPGLCTLVSELGNFDWVKPFHMTYLEIDALVIVLDRVINLKHDLAWADAPESTAGRYARGLLSTPLSTGRL
jgi:hypothetical protein